MTVVVAFSALTELKSDAEAITDANSWNVEELIVTTSIAVVVIAAVLADAAPETVVAAPKLRLLCALVASQKLQAQVV